MASLLQKIRFRLRTIRPRLYPIGPHLIELPAGHLLDYHQKIFPLYDLALGEVTRIVHAKYPEMRGVDIGANIGDSAALMCKYATIPLVCVEGNCHFLPWLKRNAERISSDIRIEACYLGGGGEQLDQSLVAERRGTSSIVEALVSENKLGAVRPDTLTLFRRLPDILDSTEGFSSPKLIKLDTDGFDFAILEASLAVLEALRPVLFFEYDPFKSIGGFDEGLRLINGLHRIGYRHFFVYDNRGQFITEVESPESFGDLQRYLFPGGKRSIKYLYFDVCALAQEDEDLATQIVAGERR